MLRHHRRQSVATTARALLLALALSMSGSTIAAQDTPPRLPERLSDAEFWALVDSISEPGGYFQIADNFTSNEREIGQLFTMLRERGTRGGVYLGVGPEQNLTYIAAIRPQMAFIVDIRRQAVMQHLMFKAIFEMATDRADSGGGGGMNQTTFADLTGYSNDASGTPRSFLSSEENYAYVKDLHARNLIVPVSGDFAGPRAIRAIGSWLRNRGGTVSAFYVSNVEQYLFRESRVTLFYENVATLPVNEESIFIRPYSLRRYGLSVQFCPIGTFLAAARNSQVPNNDAAMACPR